MIDIRLIRESSNVVKKNIKKRFQKEKLELVDKVIDLDSQWRKKRYEEDKLRSSRNKISEQINQLMKAKKKKEAQTYIVKAKKIPEKIAKLQDKRRVLEKKIAEIMLQIPNILHESVPSGKDETQNVELRKWGKLPKHTFPLKSHAKLIENMGYADFEAGASNSGQGFNYLIDKMAMLDHALQRYGVDFITKKGFTLVVPPLMLNFETLLGALNGLQDFQDVVYKVEKEDLYLVGTAEHVLVSFLKNKTLHKKEFPVKLCAVTPCFRKEIGSRGVDTKGLFRMHQFNKVEQVVFSLPEDSYKILEEMQKTTEEFVQSLGIPYRVIEICSGDLSTKFAKQYDIEAWFPRQKKYAEITSAGTCTDFQARALNIKYQEGNERKCVHIMNNTMVATSRVMVAILENFQQKDGSVIIPNVLRPYMNGLKVIE